MVGLGLYTVTDNRDRDCVQRVALGRPILAVNRKPVAKCKIQTRVHGVEEIYAVGTVDNVQTSYSTQRKFVT